jgi:hypothetical protein
MLLAEEAGIADKAVVVEREVDGAYIRHRVDDNTAERPAPEAVALQGMQNAVLDAAAAAVVVPNYFCFHQQQTLMIH